MPRSGVRDLVVALLRCFGGILCGYICVRFGYLDPSKEHIKGISFVVGKICFPVLVFRAMATADLQDFVWEVIFACNMAKAVAFVIAFVLFYFGKRSAELRLQVAAVFAFFVVCSNDFAIGFPVFNIVYPPESYPQGLQTYLAINAVLLASLFMPVVLVLLSLATRWKSGGEYPGGALQTRSSIFDAFDRQLFKDALWAVLFNPAIVSAATGFLWYLLMPGTGEGRLPYFFAQFLDLATSPFQFLALFVTGAALRTVQLDKWAVVLVILKVVFCAYLGSATAQMMIPAENASKGIFVSFTYLYGSIPTASAPLFFAESFCPDYAEFVATAVILSLVVSGPAMLLSSVLFVEDVTILNEIVSDIVSVLVQYLCVPCIFAFGVLFIVARRWFAAPPMDIVTSYAFAVALYTWSTVWIITSDCREPSSTIQQSWKAAGENGFFLLPSWRVIGFGIGQQLCRSITIVLLIWRLRGFPKPGTKVAVAIAACVSVLTGSVVPPNTLNELCGLEQISKWRTPLATSIFLVVTVTAFAFPNYRPQVSRKSTAAAEIALAALHKPVAQGFLLHGLKPPAIKHVLTSTTFALGIYATVRLGVQFVGGLVLAVSDDPEVRGGATFKEMMVIENVLEHSQACMLLLLVLTGREYQPLTARLFAGSAANRLEDEVHLDYDETKLMLEKVAEDGQSLQDVLRAKAKRRRYCCMWYEMCVPGDQIVDVILDRRVMDICTRDDAIFTCQALLTYGFLVPVDGKSRWFSDSDFTWYHSKSVATQEGMMEQDFKERQSVFTHGAALLARGMVGPHLPEQDRSGSVVHSSRPSKQSLITSRQGSTNLLFGPGIGGLSLGPGGGSLGTASLAASQSLLSGRPCANDPSFAQSVD